MKGKLLAALLLGATTLAGLWLWQRHTPPPTRPLPGEAGHAVATAAPPPPVATRFASPVKMVTVRWAAPLKDVSQNPVQASRLAIDLLVEPGADYHQRLAAIDALRSHMTEAEWIKVRGFLLERDPADSSQMEQALKNRLLDVLSAMNPPVAEFSDVLIQIYHDQGQDEVIRDYAVQHLAAYYEEAGAQIDGSEQAAVQQALWSAVGETQSSVGGTALLALKNLSQQFPAQFDQNRIAAAAVQMADNNSAGELSHVTAYQVCAQLNVREALPVIVAAAQSSPTLPQQISAIGALGLLGGPEQTSLLNWVLAGNEDRLKPAARHALEQINARQN
jgi:hypothetical protein